ncbi:MAG: hypothetical protein RIR36_1245, partial [Bacteroidota bacterium]
TAVKTLPPVAGVSALEQATSKTITATIPEKMRGIFRINLFFGSDPRHAIRFKVKP